MQAANRRALELAPSKSGDLDSELAELKKRLDLSNYENKPLPRPKTR